MESIALTIKFVVIYGLGILVVTIAGTVVVEGLYPLVEEWIYSILSRIRGEHALAPTTAGSPHPNSVWDTPSCGVSTDLERWRIILL